MFDDVSMYKTYEPDEVNFHSPNLYSESIPERITDVPWISLLKHDRWPFELLL
jgi:hypothetical protein